MHISLRTLQDEPIALVPVTTDKHGYLYAAHPTFQFECDCALYGYQDGGVDADTIEDQNGNPYMQWKVVL